MNESIVLLEKLQRERSLSREEYLFLLQHRSPESDRFLQEAATRERERVYGDTVYLRGLVEISSFCKNDCLYCGIRRSNTKAHRYRLSREQILLCADRGAALGFSTFVLQGGEDPYFTDEVLCSLVEQLKCRYPDKAITLSLGERSRESYRRLKEAGADRYLLRHETANATHYARLHPKDMALSRRMACLNHLRELGYQVGCGMMVGSPFQQSHHLAEDLCFISRFRPQMCGIGPFIPHGDTPFGQEAAGSVSLTCFLLGLVRLTCPGVLLPATTALATLEPRGRQKAMAWGANVVMPNLSPPEARESYRLYNNKVSRGAEAAEGLEDLKQEMKEIGRRVVMDRGDCKEKEV